MSKILIFVMQLLDLKAFGSAEKWSENHIFAFSRNSLSLVRASRTSIFLL